MLSTYTICSNPLSEDYPIREMVISNLQFADEIVVADFGSTDGTLELLNNIKSSTPEFSTKLKIIRGDTRHENTEYFFTEAKNQALDACINDWVVRIDSDEIIPEWCYEIIRKLGEITDPNIYAFRFQRLHFYRDYNTIKLIPQDKIGYTYMFRKSTTARHKYTQGNCDGLVKNNGEFFDNLGDTVSVIVYHYGWCRPIRIIIKKIQRIEKKLVLFNELKKRHYPKEHEKEKVQFNWRDTNLTLSDKELEKIVFDMSDTEKFEGEHPSIMYERIKTFKNDF